MEEYAHCGVSVLPSVQNVCPALLAVHLDLPVLAHREDAVPARGGLARLVQLSAIYGTDKAN